MKKYQIQNSIGTGNFSTVFKGVLLPQGIPCAIKILQSHQRIAIREAHLLNKFKHPNIISIIDFQQKENESHIVLQYLGINTLQLYESQQNGLKEQQVKCILFQIAFGLSFVHSFKIIHRDIKPENILIDKRTAIVKIIDFGLAIQQKQSTTDYIATRWYRAPENLLGTKQYTCAIDVFSLACVIVQLHMGVPLFPGENNMEQIYKIFSVLGYPTAWNWPKGHQRLQQLGINIQNVQNKVGVGLSSVMKGYNPKLISILQRMLELNPTKRISCSQLLKNQYFKDIKNIIPGFIYKKFEQDILAVKNITFKGFQPVKCSKNISNQINPKGPKINFHHVSAKTRTNQKSLNQLPQINEQIQNMQTQSSQNNRNQGSRLLRQHKSTSLDSYKPILQTIKQVQKKNVIPILQQQNSARKLSTPSSIANLKLNNVGVAPQLQKIPHLRKINSPSQFFNFKDHSPKFPIQHHPVKFSFQESKRLQTTKTEQDKQATIQTINPDSREKTSQIQKKFRPFNNQFHNQNKKLKNINQGFSQNQSKIKIETLNSPSFDHMNKQKQVHKQNANNFSHVYIPHIKAIQQQQVDHKNKYSSITMNLSPIINKAARNSHIQSVNSSINYHSEHGNHPLSFHFSSKNFPIHQKQVDSSHRFNNTKSFNNMENLSVINQNHKQQNRKIKKIDLGNKFFAHTPTSNPNYLPFSQNSHRIQQISKKPQFTYKSPNKQFLNNNYIASPHNNRYSFTNSPENNLSMQRNKRINAMPGSIQPFFSPPQRKY